MEREKFRPLTVLEPKARQKEKTKLFPTAQLKQPQALKQPQLQKTIQITPPPLRTPLPTLTFPTVPRFELPEVKDISRGRGLFGKWFLREHKIVTPEQVSRSFFGSPRKKKRKEKGVKLFGF